MVRLADPHLAERRRRQILDAALACFLRRGFHQATMQEICAEAGISPGALYRYFDSKAAIIAAIAEDASRESDGVLHQARTRADFIDAMCGVAREAFEKVCNGDDLGLMADIFAEAARDPVLRKTLHDLDAQRLGRLADTIRACQRAGALDAKLDPIDTADTLIGVLQGLAMRSATYGGAEPAAGVSRFRTVIDRYLAPNP